MTGAQAQRSIAGLAAALRDASQALDPMIADLQRDGRSDDAQRCTVVASDLLTLSSKANAIATSTLIAAASDAIANLQRVNQEMAGCAQRLAANEANVQKIVAIATAAATVVTSFTGTVDVIAAGKGLATLVGLLQAKRT